MATVDSSGKGIDVDFSTPDGIWKAVQECPVHPVKTDEDCEACDHEITQRGAIIDQMKARATETMKGLAQYDVQIPPHVMQELRMDVLLDSLIRDQRQQLQFEGEVGRRMIMTLKNIHEQVKQPTLHVPDNVRPMRKK
jgi:hypothetical protein